SSCSGYSTNGSYSPRSGAAKCSEIQSMMIQPSVGTSPGSDGFHGTSTLVRKSLQRAAAGPRRHPMVGSLIVGLVRLSERDAQPRPILRCRAELRHTQPQLTSDALVTQPVQGVQPRSVAQLRPVRRGEIPRQ